MDRTKCFACGQRSTKVVRVKPVNAKSVVNSFDVPFCDRCAKIIHPQRTPIREVKDFVGSVLDRVDQ